MASTLELLRRLTIHKVDFVLVGGMAAIAHGSSVVTEDADVVVRFDLVTLERLAKALEGTEPRERMAVTKPPLRSDITSYVGNKNLYLVTTDGVLDLLGEIVAVGTYDSVVRHAVELDLGGFSCRVIGLDDLITCKLALGRPKDLRAAHELANVRLRNAEPKF